MNTRAYLAAPWELQQDVRPLVDALAGWGVEVAARWLDATDNTYTDDWANRCLEDIRRCEVLLAWNPREWARTGTGGRHVEFGAALILNKPVVVIGAKTNIFHEVHRVALVEMDPSLVTVATIAAAIGNILADQAFWNSPSIAKE